MLLNLQATSCIALQAADAAFRAHISTHPSRTPRFVEWWRVQRFARGDEHFIDEKASLPCPSPSMTASGRRLSFARRAPAHRDQPRPAESCCIGDLAESAQLDARSTAGAARRPSQNTADASAPATARRHGAPSTASRINLPELPPATLDGRRFSFFAPAGPGARRVQTRSPVLFFLVQVVSGRDTPRSVGELPSDASADGDLANESGARWLRIASGISATPTNLRESRSTLGVRILHCRSADAGALFRAFSVTGVPGCTDRRSARARRPNHIEQTADKTQSALRTQSTSA